MRIASVLRLRPLGLHPATWLVGILAAAIFLFIALPGELIDPHKSLNSEWWDEQTELVSQSLYEQYRHKFDEARQTVTPGKSELHLHGWPRRCAIRGFGEMLDPQPYLRGYGYYGMSSPTRGRNKVRYWTQSANWPLRNDAWSIHYGNLAFNLAAMLLAVAAAMWGTDRWVRKRGGIFRLRLIDFLAVIALVAGGLGWLKYHEAAGRAERAIVEEVKTRTKWRYSVFSEYAGPEWLRRLAGGEEFLPQFEHVTKAQFRVGPPWMTDLDELARLPYLKRLTVEGAITRELVERLEEFPRLESLSLNFARLSPAQHEEIGIDEADLMTSRDLPKLGELSLETLELWGLPLELADVESLLEELSPDVLVIGGKSFSAEEFESLRKRFSGVEIKTH